MRGDGAVTAAAAARAACDPAFEALTDRLGAVQRAMGALSRQAGALAELLAAPDGAADPAKAVAEAAGALDVALARTATAEEVAAPVTAALAALEDVGREARMLDAVASLTQVTAQSLGAAGLEGYVAGLRAQIAALAGDARALDAGVRAIAAARAGAGRAGRSARAAVVAAARAVETARESSAGLAEAAAAFRGRISDEAAAATDAAQVETAALIAGVQFADELAQRLDHVGAILDGAMGREPDAAALAAAQLRALADDGAAVCDRAADALARLETLGSRLAAAVGSSDGRDPAAALLTGRRAALAAASAREAETTSALAEVEDLAGRIAATVAGADARFAGLERSAAAINLAAINATLLTARSGAARAALGVLAEAVRDSAHASTERSRICRGAIAALSAGVEAIGADEAAASAAVFRAALADSAAALDAADADASALGLLRDGAADAASRLADAACGGRNALDAVRDALIALNRAADMQAAPGARGDAAALACFEPIYTMDRERAVHAAVAGAPRDLPAPSQAPAELDSILF